MAKDESTLTVKRIIDADPETLFEALTNQKIMEQWFFASTENGWSASIENNPQEGGSFKVDMHGPDDTYPHKGVYKEIVPNKKIVFTWNSHLVTDTVVTITLSQVGGGTEVKLHHEFMPSKEIAEKHTQGWTAILENLDQVVVG
ncbi:SRPBCC domain-containing protein [Fodinibius sp. Rm-B-1B1-1]|uniref:SRPBCC family protein n=1 Tax=Fodinibius alkaliphilus TaxID=3140241 RepID=UPI00315B054A